MLTPSRPGFSSPCTSSDAQESVASQNRSYPSDLSLHPPASSKKISLPCCLSFPTFGSLDCILHRSFCQTMKSFTLSWWSTLKRLYLCPHSWITYIHIVATPKSSLTHSCSCSFYITPCIDHNTVQTLTHSKITISSIKAAPIHGPRSKTRRSFLALPHYSHPLKSNIKPCLVVELNI